MKSDARGQTAGKSKRGGEHTGLIKNLVRTSWGPPTSKPSGVKKGPGGKRSEGRSKKRASGRKAWDRTTGKGIRRAAAFPNSNEGKRQHKKCGGRKRKNNRMKEKKKNQGGSPQKKSHIYGKTNLPWLFGRGGDTNRAFSYGGGRMRVWWVLRGVTGNSRGGTSQHLIKNRGHSPHQECGDLLRVLTKGGGKQNFLFQRRGQGLSDVGRAHIHKRRHTEADFCRTKETAKVTVNGRKKNYWTAPGPGKQGWTAEAGQKRAST